MATEGDSMRALAAEAKETVILTQHLYSCVVKDARHTSGEFRAVTAPLPRIEVLEEAPAEKTPPKR
jgi:hypothetical protein